MVIAIMQTTSDRLRTVFRLLTDFRQTSDRLQTSDSYFRLWTWPLEFELQTLNFRLKVQILDFGYTSDTPHPSDFELRSLDNFRLWTI